MEYVRLEESEATAGAETGPSDEIVVVVDPPSETAEIQPDSSSNDAGTAQSSSLSETVEPEVSPSSESVEPQPGPSSETTEEKVGPSSETTEAKTGPSSTTAEVEAGPQPEPQAGPSRRNNAYDDISKYSWKNLTVREKVAKNFREKLQLCFHKGRSETTGESPFLLQNITAVANAGEVLAVLGSTGSGKTTLLTALAFRTEDDLDVTGVRAIDNVESDEILLKNQASFVPRNDVFVECLTVYEHLYFQATLKMGPSVRERHKLRAINDIAVQLKIRKWFITRLDKPEYFGGLPPGDRKRVALASEMLGDPKILICDEPTGGIEFVTGRGICAQLAEYAKRGKIVIASFYQPSPHFFESFDNLLLLSQRRTIYHGTIDETYEFFRSSIDPKNPLDKELGDPGDYYLETYTVGREDDSKQLVDNETICDEFENSIKVYQMKREMIIEMEHNQKLKCKASFCTQFKTLLWRSWLAQRRNLARTCLIHTLLIAFGIGCVFFNQKLDQNGVMNINGALFLLILSMSFQNIFIVIYAFGLEMKTLFSDLDKRLYTLTAYSLAKSIAEMPLFSAVSLLFTTITYFLIGLRLDLFHFAVTLTVISFVTNVSVSFAYFISSMSRSTFEANLTVPIILVPLVVFGGFFLNVESVSNFLRMIPFMSWFRFAYEILIVNQWAGITHIICTKGDTICLDSGKKILRSLDFKENNVLGDLIALIILDIYFRSLAMILLKIRSMLGK